VLRQQPDAVTDLELDWRRKAEEHVSPAVDRRAPARTVLVDQALEEIEANPLHEPEAWARPGRHIAKCQAGTALEIAVSRLTRAFR
jgi:hypothetical protein